ncbi:phage major capsid protein, P2 family [Kluyvera cryocrescens]|nr:phage major capsid protein, P2 family [Kluyvera cryocrescens]
MRKETRFKFNQYMSRIAELNGIATSDLDKKFTVEPSVTQTLFDKIQQSSSFLKLINMVTVSELTEEKVGIDVTGSIASTADTDGGVERKTADFAKMDAYRYFCHPVNFDYHLKYNKLDLWARFQDFQIRIRNAIIKRQALDYITIGFNGVSRAATSDRAQNPLLQDVAIGWLQKYRNDAPERVMSSVTDDDGTVISNTIKVGKGGHYANLDALVMDGFESLVAEIHRENPEMVVICGRRILTDKYFPMINKFQANSEQRTARR